MRRFAILSLFLGITLVVSSCGKSQEVKNVEQMISAISMIAVGDETPIIEAEKAYSALSAEDKQQVEDLNSLQEARTSFDKWAADKAEADVVEEKIDQIGEVTLDSLRLIIAARSVYNGLNAAQKELVGNYNVLTAAEDSYPKLQIEKVVSLIESIGNVTLESNKVVKEAESAFNGLETSLKEQVSNYSILKSALETLIPLVVGNVEDLIDAIGDISLSSEDDIKSAERAYTALSGNERELVSNYSVLTDSRNTYNELASEERIKIATDEARSIIRVTRIWCSRPDFVGGVELYFNFVNNSEKTMKYITIGATFYNAVNDIVTCTIERDEVNYCKATGPFEKGKGMSGSNRYWGPYYNSTIASVKLVSLNIEYMDGTTVKLTPAQIKYVQY